MRDLFLFLSHDDGVICLLGYCNKTLVFAELCTSCTGVNLPHLSQDYVLL